MTDQPNVGTAPATGAPETPNSSVSPQGTPPIEGADQLLNLLESRFSSKFDNLTKELRGLQSRQDKAENSFQERLAKLDQLQGQGLSREQALAKMEAEDADVSWRKNLETRLEQIASQLGSGGTQTNRQQQVADVFANVGLDPKDPRVAPFLVKEYQSPEAMELAAYRLHKELTQTPTPTAAQGASLQSKPESRADVAELTQKYQNDMLAARGKPSELKRIKEEARKNGVPVDSIVFA